MPSSQGNQGATATLQTETEFDRDAQAIFERQQAITTELKDKADDKIYRGLNGYALFLPTPTLFTQPQHTPPTSTRFTQLHTKPLPLMCLVQPNDSAPDEPRPYHINIPRYVAVIKC
jgi:hypothetical protein